MNTISVGDVLGVSARRGDYVYLRGVPTAVITTSGPYYTGYLKKTVRVIGTNSTTLTVRDVHRWTVVEWFRARVEDVRWLFV